MEVPRRDRRTRDRDVPLSRVRRADASYSISQRYKVSTALSAAYASIAKTGPGNKAKREKLLDVLTHIGKHRHRMRYHALRRDDLDIATGIIEGAIRNLVRMRLDGPGMRWSRGRSEWVLYLRCILLNGQWDDFAAHLAHRGPLQLAATPTPTRSHDAAKRAA